LYGGTDVSLPTQVTSAEKTARNETALRSFSPKDIADMDISGGGTASTVPWGGIIILSFALSCLEDY
jgi:hypothetical protein